jgi:hypothetical protein
VSARLNIGGRIAAIVVAAIILGIAAAALGAERSTSRQSATVKFADHRSGHPSGLRLRIDYVNPADSSAKPPAVRHVVVALTRGARFDTTIPARCGASDAELMSLGTSACPARSIVGTGVITLDTGVPGPGRFVTSDTIFLNNVHELIFLNTVRGSGQRVVVRARVTRRKTITDASFLPGSPPDGAAIDTVRIDLFPVSRRIAGHRRGYITTPQRCPARGFWVNRAAFTYYDGVRQSVKNHSRCS